MNYGFALAGVLCAASAVAGVEVGWRNGSGAAVVVTNDYGASWSVPVGSSQAFLMPGAWSWGTNELELPDAYWCNVELGAGGAVVSSFGAGPFEWFRNGFVGAAGWFLIGWVARILRRGAAGWSDVAS